MKAAAPKKAKGKKDEEVVVVPERRQLATQAARKSCPTAPYVNARYEEERLKIKAMKKDGSLWKAQLRRKLARAAINAAELHEMTAKNGIVSIDMKQYAPASLTGKALDSWAINALKLKFDWFDNSGDYNQEIDDDEIELFRKAVSCLKEEEGKELLSKMRGNNSDDDAEDDDEDGDDDDDDC